MKHSLEASSKQRQFNKKYDDTKYKIVEDIKTLNLGYFNFSGNISCVFVRHYYVE